MDLYIWRYILIGLATIVAIVLFFVEEKISKNSDKENIEFKENQDIINQERKEFEDRQDETNFMMLNQINELQRQFDLSKAKNSSFKIGNDEMTYDEIQVYLEKQTNVSNNLLNKALAHYGLGQIKESERLFIQALKTYPKNEDKKALIHSYLGELYLGLQGELSQAKNNSLLAYKFYKSKLNEGLENNLYEYGNITSNLGRILKREAEYKSALNYYNESLLVREKLAKENPEKYLIDLGSIYNNIAVMFREKPELGNAETMYLKALEIKRNAAENNLNYLPTVATTLNNLGNFYMDKDFYKAETYYNEAIDISQFIVDNGNKEYQPILANYQSGLAFAIENLYLKNQNKEYFKKSESLFIKALENYKLIETQEIYYFEYSNCLHNLGRLYKTENHTKKAEIYYTQALGIREKSAVSRLPIDEVSLADTQLSLALLYTENLPNKTLALKYANLSFSNYNKNIDFRGSKKWINVSREIIDYWNNH